jgi:hypothetical protein
VQLAVLTELSALVLKALANLKTKSVREKKGCLKGMPDLQAIKYHQCYSSKSVCDSKQGGNSQQETQD